MPKEETLLIPLKYIDVTRTTHTNLDVKQEKRIDDYWNIDGSRDLSDPWTGFTQFYSIGRKTSRRIYVVWGEFYEETAYIQARSSMARAMEVNGEECEAEGKAKVVDVTRSTHTDLDVSQEKRIDDHGNDDSSRHLSVSWRGVTKFTLLKENFQKDRCGPGGD